jgi:hypothetical protein
LSELVPQLILIGLTGLVSFARAFAGVRARLAMLEGSAKRAHARLDEHLHDHITGAL